MRMVGHAMNRQKLLVALRDNASQVLVEFLLVSRVNQTLPLFDSKNDLKVNLRIGVGHRAIL
jgi:hypothetical protein